MRKRLVLFALMLVVAVGALFGISAAVNEQKDRMEIEEEVLTGDLSEAEGLAIQAVSHMDYQLFWTTILHPGAAEVAETTFRFWPSRRSSAYEGSSYLEVRLGNANYGISGNVDLDDPEDREGGWIWKPAADVASRTPSGDQRTEIVALNDYYDSFPMTFDYWLESEDGIMSYWVDSTEQDFEDLTAFFDVPIPDDVKMSVTVGKNADGTVVEINCNYAVDNVYDLWTSTVMTEEGGYFIIPKMKNREEEQIHYPILDSDRVNNDYGIYCFPVREKYEDQSGVLTPVMSELHNGFPIEGDENAVLLQHDAETDQLLLLTEGQGHLWLTVIDRPSMRELQRLDLGELGERESVFQMIHQGDLLMVTIEEEYDADDEESEDALSRRLVLLKREESTWSLELHAPLTWTTADGRRERMEVGETVQLAYEDGRLAIAQRDPYSWSCDVYVAVCQSEELRFAGAYRWKNTAGSDARYDDMILPWTDGFAILRWSEK